MARNRRRLSNKVPVRAMSPWLLIAVLLFAAGMLFVFYKNAQHIRGARIKEMERELAALNSQNNLLKADISQLSSRKELAALVKKFGLKLVEIPADRLVLLKAPGKPGETGNELQAVANGGARQ